MSKIKLIVEIDEEYFHMIQKEGGKNYLECAILHGTPLPKGHGRLIDADNLPLNAIDDANYGSNYIIIAPTIIEKDGD